MRYRSYLAMSAAGALAASMMVAATGPSSAVGPEAADSAQSAPYGSFAYSGQEAADFVLPQDVRQMHTSTFADGRTSTRYQQVVDSATVFGGQITVIQGTSGQADSVIGAYFPGLEAKNSAELSKGQAKKIVTDKIGEGGDFSNELRINPRTGRLFYEVESIRAANRPARWIDAASGNVVKSFDKIASGEGTGVKGDTKTIDTTLNATSGLYDLFTGDLRQKTFDAHNNDTPTVMTDANDVWDLNRGIRSPSQPAGVDAHYYANVVDDFYRATFGRNSMDDAGMRIISVVHYGNRYCNAFWNGAYMTYGDGDGKTCLPLSGGLDVDSHELTHGVTEHTSNLIYENESGALNEAFSDMMGNSTEFYAQDNGLDPAAEPDWLIGEDIYAPDSTTPGFRNMGDPAQFNDPDHVVDKYTGTADNGGVHSNSGIANHAYYLNVNGWQNAAWPRRRRSTTQGSRHSRSTRTSATPATRHWPQPVERTRRPSAQPGAQSALTRAAPGAPRRRRRARATRARRCRSSHRIPTATTATARGRSRTARQGSRSTSASSTRRPGTTTCTSRMRTARSWRRTTGRTAVESPRRASLRRAVPFSW